MDTPPRRIICQPMVTSAVIYFMEMMRRTDNIVVATTALIAATLGVHLLRRYTVGGRYEVEWSGQTKARVRRALLLPVSAPDQ
jgi:hypothetical protein